MTPAQFGDWSRHSVRSFSAQQVAAGLQPAPEAAAFAERQILVLLPSGLDTPQHSEAYVFDVEILPEARGRGLGRATMLAAEEAARDQRADVVRLNVFGHNVPAIRLYESLGYSAASISMAKPLRRPDARLDVAGPRLELRDMTAEEYVAFRARLETGHAADLARSGAMPLEEARRTVADNLASLLPRGRLSPGNLLWTAYVDGEAVGHVWCHLDERSDGMSAFVHDLAVREDPHDPGRGLALLAEAERGCRARGVTSMGLSVVGGDTAARSLYEEAGFEVTALSMVKRL
jgi:ribosomal protein S18 acetylase RimI-like enzyme